MNKSKIIETLVKVVVAALTAFLTAITTTSCLGCGPFYPLEGATGVFRGATKCGSGPTKESESLTRDGGNGEGASPLTAITTTSCMGMGPIPLPM